MVNENAETIASTISNEIIAYLTTPKTIVTDNDREFNNKFVEAICKLLNTSKINVQAYHPQSNGAVEKVNRKVITCLRNLINPLGII